MTTPQWHPLTPAAREEWARCGDTRWFRDVRGQVGFGTADLAQAMGCKPVEWKEL